MTHTPTADDLKTEVMRSFEAWKEAEQVRDAAPDLLEACQAFVSYSDMDEDDHTQLMLAYSDMLSKARAAILKATGTSSS